MPIVMTKHLKPKQYYIDLYDRGTVERLRRWENICLTEDGGSKTTPLLRQFLFDFTLNFRKGGEYERKDETIRDWMNQDEARDALVASAYAPEGIRCRVCSGVMKAGGGDLCTWRGEHERVLFIYECLNGHYPMRAFFAGGEEYQYGESTTSREEVSYTVTEEILDKDFEKDRARFCLTEKKGLEYTDFKYKINHITELFEKNQEREKEKDVYDEAAKIRKLTITDLQKLLTPILVTASYINLQFGEPDIGKLLFVPFFVDDARSERGDAESSYNLKEVIGMALESTNWRLASEGVSYRVGILTGRLRAYEREEDLVELVRRRNNRRVNPY